MFLTHFQFTSQPFAERISAAALWQDDRVLSATVKNLIFGQDEWDKLGGRVLTAGRD